MIKEAEYIILNKEYFELSAEELLTVNEYVQNEAEFEEMKWFLASTQQTLVTDKIEASPELKKSVMDHLNQSEDKRKFWLNGVVVFLFPEDKRVHRKPAFQLAMVALLVIGFFFVMDKPFEESNMALNTIDEEEVAEDGTNEIMVDSISHDEAEVELEEEELMDETVTRDNNLELRNASVMIEQEDDEIDMVADELPQDGYYLGPLEEAEDEPNVNAGGSVVGNNNTNTLNTTTDSYKKDANQTVVDLDASTSVSSGDVKPGNDKSVRKEEKDKRKNSIERKKLLKSNEAPVVATESVEDLEISNKVSGGVELNEVTTSDDQDNSLKVGTVKDTKGFSDKEREDILPKQMHVNETKELKQLFSTYK
jgi:hypothetical protein